MKTVATALCCAFLATAASAETIDPARIIDAATGDWNQDGQQDVAILAAPAEDGEQIGIYIYLRDQDHQLLRLAVSAPDKISGSTDADGAFGQEPSIKAIGKASIAVRSQNSAIGRDRWDQTLTLVYRDKQFIVAGYTYNHYDTLDPSAGGSCDFNALTGSMQKDGKSVKAAPKTIAIQDWTGETGVAICGN